LSSHAPSFLNDPMVPTALLRDCSSRALLSANSWSVSSAFVPSASGPPSLLFLPRLPQLQFRAILAAQPLSAHDVHCLRVTPERAEKTSKYIFIIEPPTEFVYFPYKQRPQQEMILLTESLGDPSGLAAPLRKVIRSLMRISRSTTSARWRSSIGRARLSR
jgi:hypothetical protein